MSLRTPPYCTACEAETIIGSGSGTCCGCGSEDVLGPQDISTGTLVRLADDMPGKADWCWDMELAPKGRNMGEPLSILLYVPSMRLRPVREGFFQTMFDAWAWYGANSKSECLANQPVAWRYMLDAPS